MRSATRRALLALMSILVTLSPGVPPMAAAARDGLPLVLFRDDWALQHAEEKHPELKFLSAAPQLKVEASAA